MRVRDLQEFLSKFTENKKDGSSQGNAMRLVLKTKSDRKIIIPDKLRDTV
jgi:hypothetical protein